jgi:hypothetical protein
MHRSFAGRFVIVFAILACESTVAWGWNAAGHKTVAEIAWQKLDATTRSTIVALLKQHPMFSDDFAPQMKSDIGDGASTADKDHWIFCHAATWPDIARDEPLYTHPIWHYINLPVFSSDDEAAAFVGQLPVNVFFDPASTPDENDFNGVQAVKWNLGILTDPSRSDPDKAIACCWILHLIGDLAQPLHSSALFSAELFPKGDHGGGLIHVKHANASGDGDKLHSNWDAFLGTSTKFSTIKDKANNLVSNHSAEFNAPFVALPNDVWSTETQQIAVSEAYQSLMNAVRAAEQHGGHLLTIKLADSYFKNGKKVAERQAVTAGVRLAGVLKQATNTNVPAPAFAKIELGFPGLIAPVTPHASAASSALAAPPLAGNRNDADALATRVASLEAQVRRLQTELSARSPSASNVSPPPVAAHADEDKRSIVARALSAALDHEEDWDCGCGKDEADRNEAQPVGGQK